MPIVMPIIIVEGVINVDFVQRLSHVKQLTDFK